MVLKLTIIEGPDTGRTFTLPENEPQLIGRSSEALPITDTTVSRRHAELTPDMGKWYVRDLESQNNTYVNGREIRERHEIRDGDRIRVGATVFAVGELDPETIGLVELVGEDELDTDIEGRLPSNEDSLVLAEPEPGRAAVEHLRVIYQLTALTSQTADKQKLLERVMELVFEEFAPERGVIMLVKSEPAGGISRHWDRPGADGPAEIPREGDIPLAGLDLEPAVVKSEVPLYVDDDEVSEEDEDDGKIKVSKTIVYTCIREGEGILSSNAQADPRFQSGDSVTEYNIRSAICSPIKFGETTFGAIYIDSSMANYTFTAEQLALMNAIGQHTALALANAEQTSRRLHTERLAAIGETVAGLGHSIKNILQGLRGGADVVEMGLRKGDLKVAASGWGILKRNLDRIVGLTLNMLTFSRQRHLELEQTNIGRLLADCRELAEAQAADKKAALVVDAEGDIPPIPIDPNLLHQAVMNLVTNAIDAVAPDTGIVTLRAIYHEPGHTTLRISQPVVEIAVVDNGTGIPKDRLAWIFEPFNTSKGLRGTGLGLAVTRRIVNDHRGRIRVETAEGKGSTFRVLLPCDLDRLADPSETHGGGKTLVAPLRGKRTG